jgi:signal transduction histidine kinase
MREIKKWPAVLTFVLLQAAWVAIVVIWIIWFVRRHQSLIQGIGPFDIVIIVEGAVLLLLILIGIYVLFILYQRQLTLARTQGHILSSITHEFKTPLATIQLYLETLKKRELSPEMMTKLIDGMMVENRRLQSMVEKFLASANPGYSKIPYYLNATSLKKFVEDFLHKNNGLLEQATVTVDVEDDVYVKIDSDAMDMAFRNLAENAIRYTKNTPCISIKGFRNGKWTVIEFADSGVGIPEDKRGEIFKMFKRLPEAVSLWSSGTGLGLYVVKQIIDAHGGKIRVDGMRDFSKDTGAVFVIRLPGVKKDG